ncbi:RNA polymerase subunit sigma [Candidatus Epulonipiscium fishelsonii]|uniref:RNA polymerase subunit sigma n=1 Tax=Candidatus Epulonipiscium fishelsonii TaxID=77094 RepID=A0ACC8XDN9_9FIRM|nr:RNA polymerase subunit sigma [Epulopiscium sp. SCG-B05WGA-EpuloA1]ONI41006.1 RNA polymerase subunit sigma [Epulopiscium sp. SCG-B11WGA-EpuloA1]ONI46735.1 RNA polymerase subunit sigma [Epulopiscium sp. SCG-C06WGA-EpuloA1]
MGEEKDIDLLWGKYRNGKSLEIKQQLIAHYAQLVKIVAGRLGIYLNNHVELDDLIGYGVIGLIDAIDKFDPDKQVKFETYASLRIRGAIIDEIRKLDWVPRTLRRKQKEFLKNCSDIEVKLGRPPTQDELLQEMGITEEEYFKILQETHITNLVSMDENENYISNISDEGTPNPSEEFEKQELFDILTVAINELSDREQTVIKLYYFEELTLREISHVLNVSESRISQLHTKSINKLKFKLGKYQHAFPL